MKCRMTAPEMQISSTATWASRSDEVDQVRTGSKAIHNSLTKGSCNVNEQLGGIKELGIRSLRPLTFYSRDWGEAQKSTPRPHRLPRIRTTRGWPCR